MVQGILMIFAPRLVWDEVKEAKRGTAFILGFTLMPVLLLLAVVEGFALVHWGRVMKGGHVKLFAVQEAVLFQVSQVGWRVLAVLVVAILLRAFARTFHSRHDFRQAFTVVALAMLPSLLIRGLDVFPWMPMWLTWMVGVWFSLRALYVGVPVILDPDRPQAFGLFVLTAGIMVLIGALWRLAAGVYLTGRLIA